MRSLKPGFTLHEMIMSLAVLGAVVGLAVHVASRQSRFYRGLAETATNQQRLGHATGIAASILWGVSPVGGDILLPTDSAIELRGTIGSAITCDSAAGRVTIPAATMGRGNALSAFVESPEPDDMVRAFLEDSAGATWLTLHVASPPVTVGGCARFPGVAASWTMSLREPLTIPAGTVLRFLRPLRLSLYRASDSRYYLGARDWNGESQRFNTIQPVAGPLDAYADPGSSGWVLAFFDSRGVELPQLADPSRIATIWIVARGGPDSLATAIGLRNAR